MKKAKKVLGLVLALILIMSVMSIQSFAYFDWFNDDLPTVESVKFVDNNAISLKEMQSYFDEVEDWYGEGTDEEESGLEYECFYLGESAIDYEVEVSLSDGTTFNLKLNEYYADLKDYEVGIDCAVYYSEYIAAKNGNKKSVDVEISYIVATSDDTISDYYNEPVRKSIVSSYVRSISPVSGIPTAVYKNADYYNIDGAKFLVTYADNSTKTLTVDMSMDDNGFYEYHLGNNRLYVFENYNNELQFCFMDEVYTKKVSYKEGPFKSIKIKECEIDRKTDTLSSIKYDVTLKDGTVKSFEKSFDNDIEFYDYYYIDAVEGYYVWIYVSDYELTDDGEYLTDNYCITATVGALDDGISDTLRVKNPGGFFLRIKLAFEQFIERVKWYFANIFNWA